MGRVGFVTKYTDRHKRRLVEKETEECMKRLRKAANEILHEKKIVYSANEVNEVKSHSIEQSNKNSSNITINQDTSVNITPEQETVNSEPCNTVNSENCVPTGGISAVDRNDMDVNVNHKESAQELYNEEIDDVACLLSDDLELTYRYSDNDDDDEEVCAHSENSKKNKWKTILEVSMQKVCEAEAKSEVSLIKKFRRQDSESTIISKQLTSLLPRWQASCKVQVSHMTELLHGSRKEVPLLSLPLDGRTLIKTPRHTVTHQMGGGEYHHFGLLSCLNKIVAELQRKKIKNNTIELFINVDGAPVGKSSSKDLWPILCSDKVIRKVYIVGVFYGPSKPEDANEYLTHFVEEAKEYVNNGLTVDDLHYNVFIDGIICDAPAKAYILGVNYHSGYFSCTKCNIKGTSEKGVCFPGGVAEPRTDEKFRKYCYTAIKKSNASNCTDKKIVDHDGYQVKKTVLVNIPKLGLVSQVPLDPMHLVFLGLVRKLLLLWKLSATHWRLPIRIINWISEILVALAEHVPCEFARKPRHLKDIKQFKATEFRQTGLYTGVIAFKEHLNPKVYKSFLILHVVITIFSNPILCKDSVWVNYAENLSQRFVKQFATLYGKRYVSHNVHNFLHLADDVRRYGDLESFSAFRFESAIFDMKRFIRGTFKPLQQLARRCKEVEILQDTPLITRTDDVLRQKHTQGPLTSNFKKVDQFSVGYFDGFKINCSDDKNNYLLIDGIHVVRVLNIVLNSDDKETYVVGQKLTIIGPVYTYPCSSSRFHINIVHESMNADFSYWNVKCISAKLFKMPFQGHLAVFPILHTLQCSTSDSEIKKATCTSK